MKKLYLLATRPWIYLSEIPLVALLVIAILQNGKSDGVFKLYPLITMLILGIILIFLYFFKTVVVSTEEVQVFSVFSHLRDGATLNKDKTLIIGKISGTRIKVCVYGNDGKLPEFDFIENGEDTAPLDIFLLRCKALGGNGTLVRIMKYFDIPTEQAEKLTLCDTVFEDDLLFAESLTGEGEYREIKIRFKKTI